MALEQFVSGPYIGTYKAPGGAAQPIGLCDEGYELQFTPQGENIENSDVYGGALLDGITRGHNASLTFTMKSYQRALTNGLIWQFSANPLLMQLGAQAAAIATGVPTGRLWSALAGEIVLTGQRNTPAYTVDATAATNNVFGATSIMTAPLAILAPGQSINFMMNSKLRQVTLAMVLLPYSNNGSPASIIFGVAS